VTRVVITDVIPRKAVGAECMRRVQYIKSGLYPAVWQGHYILIRTGEDELLQGMTKEHSEFQDRFAIVRVECTEYWIEEVEGE
jgi:hypothetical protein